jgi:hypothetical protein
MNRRQRNRSWPQTCCFSAPFDIGQGERTTAGSSSFLNGLLGMTRQTGGSTLAFTRTPGGSLVSMRSGTNH